MYIYVCIYKYIYICMYAIIWGLLQLYTESVTAIYRVCHGYIQSLRQLYTVEKASQFAESVAAI